MSSSARSTYAPRTTPSWCVWWLAIRPKTLPAAAAPVMVGTAFAFAAGQGHWGAALGALVGALLIQIGTNLANDYSDWKKGADTAQRLGPARASQQGWVSTRAVAMAAAFSFAAATLIGALLAWRAGWPVIVIGVVSVLCGLTYTGGRHPYGYRGLGDLAVFLFFGPVAVCGTYYVQALRWATAPLLASVGVGAIATGILVVNNIRDRHTDAAADKRTLAVALGLHVSRIQYSVLIGAAYAVLPVLAIIYPPWPRWFIPCFGLPWAIRATLSVWRRDGASLNASLAETARLGLIHALLLSIAALVEPTWFHGL